MPRLDVSRATGRPMELTAGHDGRLVADVVGDWARRHAQPFALTLTGPAGAQCRARGGGGRARPSAPDLCLTPPRPSAGPRVPCPHGSLLRHFVHYAAAV